MEDFLLDLSEGLVLRLDLVLFCLSSNLYECPISFCARRVVRLGMVRGEVTQWNGDADSYFMGSHNGGSSMLLSEEHGKLYL